MRKRPMTMSIALRYPAETIDLWRQRMSTGEVTLMEYDACQHALAPFRHDPSYERRLLELFALGQGRFSPENNWLREFRVFPVQEVEL